MFKLAQKKKEEQEKKEQAEKPGYAKQMSIRSKLLTQGEFYLWRLHAYSHYSIPTHIILLLLYYYYYNII